MYKSKFKDFVIYLWNEARINKYIDWIIDLIIKQWHVHNTNVLKFLPGSEDGKMYTEIHLIRVGDSVRLSEHGLKSIRPYPYNFT